MELKRAEVSDLIQQCLIALNAERGADEQIDVGEATPLLGGESQLDSLAFVSLVGDLEERLHQLTGQDLTLVGELDPDGDHPFRSVSALTDRIVELAARLTSE
jgi:acyl carrier protein